jgi:hypothetical protein
MTEAAEQTWSCPRDGAAMVPMRRRAGVWRCPTCGGIFIDVDGMRRGEAGYPPAWPRVFLNVAASLIAVALVRRLFRRKERRPGRA